MHAFEVHISSTFCAPFFRHTSPKTPATRPRDNATHNTPRRGVECVLLLRIPRPPTRPCRQLELLQLCMSGACVCFSGALASFLGRALARDARAIDRPSIRVAFGARPRCAVERESERGESWRARERKAQHRTNVLVAFVARN